MAKADASYKTKFEIQHEWLLHKVSTTSHIMYIIQMRFMNLARTFVANTKRVKVNGFFRLPPPPPPPRNIAIAYSGPPPPDDNNAIVWMCLTVLAGNLVYHSKEKE